MFLSYALRYTNCKCHFWLHLKHSNMRTSVCNVLLYNIFNNAFKKSELLATKKSYVLSLMRTKC